MELHLSCRRHPRYRTHRNPTGREASNPNQTCWTCWFLYYAHNLKMVPLWAITRAVDLKVGD